MAQERRLPRFDQHPELQKMLCRQKRTNEMTCKLFKPCDSAKPDSRKWVRSAPVMALHVHIFIAPCRTAITWITIILECSIRCKACLI